MKTVDCLLEDANWAVEDLAAKAGLTNERAEAIALGRWTPSPAERQRIATAFQIPTEDVSWGHTMDPRNVRYRRFGFKDIDDSDRGTKSATPG